MDIVLNVTLQIMRDIKINISPPSCASIFLINEALLVRVLGQTNLKTYSGETKRNYAGSGGLRFKRYYRDENIDL